MAAVKHVCTFENCGKEFSKLSRLTIHTRTHTGERPFVCQYVDCFKSYARQQHLKRHEEVTHKSTAGELTEPQKSQFRCTIDGCDGAFLSKHSLNRHVHRIHHKDIYKCPANGCEEVFKKHQQLKTHYAVHQEEYPYQCPEPGCGKRFPFPNRLRLHIKTHEGYRCEEKGCEAVFVKWTLLVKHRKVHHQTAHTCSLCGKSFAQKQWLKEHSLVHSEQRPVFECPHPQCQREYLNQRNLNAHIKSYHDQQRFPCEEPGCGRTFATKQKVQQHLKLHDPDKPVVKKKKLKKSTAAKLTGIKSYETEARGESVDEIMTLDDLDNDLELSDLHLTLGWHGSSDTERNNDMLGMQDKTSALDVQLVIQSGSSALKTMCSEKHGQATETEVRRQSASDEKYVVSEKVHVLNSTSNTSQCRDNSSKGDSAIRHSLEVKS